MNTLAVMCIALHRTKPFLDAALADHLLDLRRDVHEGHPIGKLNVRYSVSDFIGRASELIEDGPGEYHRTAIGTRLGRSQCPRTLPPQ